MRIVLLKNSDDIIASSTIGSIKAFVDESERESARAVVWGNLAPVVYLLSDQTAIAFIFDVYFSLTANVGVETAAARL